MPNQHLPTPPLEDLDPWILYYWRLGMNDKEIAKQVMDHFDREEYGCSYKTVQRRRKTNGLLGTRQQKATFEFVAPYIYDIRLRFPTMGAGIMRNTLRQDFNIKVSKDFLIRYYKEFEPDALRRRKLRRFRRKRFWSAGVMDIIAVDQHDKWKRFGLWLHVGLDPFTGRIAWLRVWWTNRNSRLICSYYINAGREVGGIPLVTQSDPGSENFGLANCHTNARHHLDPSLQDTLQHRWMREHQNVKPEALWSQLRRQFTPGFENILDYGYNQGIYNPDDPLEKLVFRWLAIPWLQAELDKWTRQFNSTPRRADRNKVLPHGIPDLIHAKPHLYDTEDFTVKVSPELFDQIEEQWAPTTDPVFLCTPALFDEQAHQLYAQIGSPPVTLPTFWDIFVLLLNAFNEGPTEPLQPAFDAADDGFLFDVPLIEGLRELRNGALIVGQQDYVYYGGLETPPGIPNEETTSFVATSAGSQDNDVDLRDYAYFSD